MLRRPDRRGWTLLVLALALLPLVVSGCGGDDNPPPFIPIPDTTPPVLTATPAQGWFTAAVDVELTAVDNRDADPVIYYTMDLSTPDDTSPMYVAPITVAADTVIKCYAVDASDNASDMQTLGYVIAPSTFKQEWAESGHGDIAAEAWRHWDEDGEVQTGCAKCHSGDGFRDFAEDGVVDVAAPLPLGLDCSGCHENVPMTLWDDLALFPAMEPILFPSGETATLRGNSNMCMACHQGRASGVTVNEAILDNPAGPYSFINVHYFAAAATMFGGEVNGGYEYLGLDYQGRNVFPSHPDSLSTCTGCHMPGASPSHTFAPDEAGCIGCHTGTSFETLGGTPVLNFDSIEALTDDLYAAIQAYGTTLGFPIVYDDHTYPYFFNDLNANGVGDPDEINYGNRYVEFDAALLKAAYNYQVALKDPAGYIHNGTYIQQILYDSTLDINGTASLIAPGRVGFDVETATETQQWQLSGHADIYGEAFRHWDDDPEIPDSCTKCHTTPGFIEYAANVPTTAQQPGSTIECTACHTSPNLYTNADTRWDTQDDAGSGPLLDVVFPSGLTGSLNGSSNICMACHQGRDSGKGVADTIAADAGVGPYTFQNIHYFAAAATMFGSDVWAGFEYSGQTYVGLNTFPPHGGNDAIKTCTGCHLRGSAAEHTFEAQVMDCSPCHTSMTGQFSDLTGSPGTNYTAIQTSLVELYVAMQAYAPANMLPYIVYDSHAYPYFFNDLNEDGVTDPDEVNYGNRYVTFDAKLLPAAYNYQVGQKDPGGYIHNGDYIRQVLYDSIVDMGGTPTVTRP